MMSTPLVSIITLCKDNVEDLRATIDSLIECLPIEKIEVIVVSGSTNENFNHESTLYPHFSQIRIFRTEPLGVYNAMNYGLSLFSGSWVWFLNSGDFCSITNPVEFINILSNERDAQSDALLFFGSIRSRFSLYPVVGRPPLLSIIDKDKWFQSYPCMHPSIIVSSNSLKLSAFKYSTLNRIDSDQEYIQYFQNLPRTRAHSLSISQFTLGGISTRGPFSFFHNLLSLEIPDFIYLIDDGLILLKLFVFDIIRSLFSLK